MARGQEIKCRGFVPDGNGGYRPLEVLSPEEKQELSEHITQRMGQVLNTYFGLHPEIYKEI